MKFRLLEQFENDEIFLLSQEEYEKYKRLIPNRRDWWLRSPGYKSFFAVFVDYDGSVYHYGYHVMLANVAVRPALKISDQESSTLKPGEEFEKYSNIWIYLGDNLVISKDEIATRRFDTDDNDYESSEIRMFLLDWLRKRKKNL